MKKYKEKNWLYSQYVEDEKSTVQISDVCDVSPGTISYWLKKLEINSRDLSESLEGRKLSEESKEKISKSVSEHLEENGHPFEGEEHTDEAKKIMSEKQSGENNNLYNQERPEFAEQMTGPDNPSWKGGITQQMDFRKSNKWQTFSTEKKEEANWTCENCSAHGSESEIHTHHAKPVSSGGEMYDNTFIVLCKECHKTNYEFWHNSSVEEQLSKVGR
jgi:Pyruvate/2-oxoacid:ferredoxin oxidoreductase delta subunit